MAHAVKNGEELATIIGQAINENLGKGGTQSHGGTFMPSMGNAQRQDRQWWIELDWNCAYNNATASSSQSYIEGINDCVYTSIAEQIPACGWIMSTMVGVRSRLGLMSSLRTVSFS